MAKKYQIAIDGPVGAGKSTIAKKLSEKLVILYVDTGAMYRALALYTKNKKVKWTNEARVTELAGKLKVEMKPPTGKQKDGRNVTVLIDGKDVSREIRQAEFGEGASVVSQYFGVREILVRLQQQLVHGQSVVMEGRDIGTRVLPKAEIKIYMDADIDERVARKLDQLEKMGHVGDYGLVKQDVITRDKREMMRIVDPLRPADGAWILDTTDLSADQVVDRIVSKVELL